MIQRRVAVLLTCHNRKNKTLKCLRSLFDAETPPFLKLEVFLTDDGSEDGTEESVKSEFPQVFIFKGDGNLYWTGGMRLSWISAINYYSYDAFLLLNDDVILKQDFILNLLLAEEYAVESKGMKGVYSGATIDVRTQSTTYGASKIKHNHFVMRHTMLNPKTTPQECEITNANILWVDKSVVDKIGILDGAFTHGIADYDYSLRAHNKNIPVLLAPNICGICQDDHGNNWRPSTNSLSERVSYLKSPKGLAYKEYLFYVRRHFPLFLPYSFIMLWAKTFFPFLWDKYKNK